MVVFGQGRVIQPEDIPPEVRLAPASRTLLPVPIPRASKRESEGPAPELEFIFRTLLQLRVDVEDLRRDFDEYRRTHPELASAVASAPYPLVTAGRAAVPAGIEIARIAAEPPVLEEEDEGEEEEEGVVVYRPGKTMSDLEREAILAALREVGGNRRKAAEMLGIGERTLYRKIKEYGIPV
jgi:DNA-binding NtrC family response regulator